MSKLYQLWGNGTLTTDQMVGHLFQHQFDHEQRLYRLEQATQVLRK